MWLMIDVSSSRPFLGAAKLRIISETPNLLSDYIIYNKKNPLLVSVITTPGKIRNQACERGPDVLFIEFFQIHH